MKIPVAPGHWARAQKRKGRRGRKENFSLTGHQKGNAAAVEKGSLAESKSSREKPVKRELTVGRRRRKSR